jgi:glyoxylase-like metal-dependent hydrolase (beta-lactamase superfamily II)
MRRNLAAVAIAVALVSSQPAAQDAATTLAAAAKAMGVDGLSSISYTGTATNGNFGQSKTIAGPLAMATVSGYTRTIDLGQPYSRAKGTATPPAVPGAPAPSPVPYNLGVAPTAAGAGLAEIWITPWGFLKGASTGRVTAKSERAGGKAFTVLTWTPEKTSPSGQPYRVNAYVNDQNLIERAETWIENPVMGDLHVEQTYSNYQDLGGVKVPTRIVQKRGGIQTFEATITGASANPANLTELLQPPAPAGGRAGGAPPPPAGGAPQAPPAAQSEKLADGVYRITGNYSALAVEFKDHVVILEGGQNEARGLAVIAETKRLIPNKPIRYVVNTHAHFDHAGGLAPFAAEGITIVTHHNNRAFLERALGAPRTLLGDALAKSGRKPKVEGAGDRRLLRDDTRTIELHHVKNLEHSDGMLIAFLPKERVLFTGDFSMPAAGQVASPAIVTLVQNVERLKLDFDRHILVHPPNPDRPLTKADLMALVKSGS